MMIILLLILSIFSFVAGGVFFAGALGTNSAIHEIEALICFLASALFFVGCAIVGAIGELKKK